VLAPQAAANDPTLYLAEAVHQELLARLSQLPRVRVLPRVALDADTDVIGVCFDVEQAVLTARLTYPAGPGSLLKFPLSIDQILPTADAIAATIGAAITHSRTALQSATEAYDLLLKARHAVHRDVTQLPASIEKLRRALELAPDDPRVMATLAVAQVRVAFFMPDVAPDALSDAMQLGRRAVTRAPDLAEAQIAAGHVELTVGNPVAAARHFRIAIARAPHLAEAHEQLGRMLLEAGYVPAALARLEEAIAIVPNLRSARWEIARAMALEDNWTEFDRLNNELIAAGIDRPLSRARYSWWRNDWKLLAELRTRIGTMDRALWPGMMEAVCAVFLDHAWDANRDLLLAAALSETPSHRRRTFTCQIGAETAAFAGDLETAIMLIEHATKYGLFDHHWLQNCKLLAPVRAHPRFAALRAPIKQRADAILDALYGDQSAALSETAIA
jgi:eukaryotic-like serine/threonine-protein kinase